MADELLSDILGSTEDSVALQLGDERIVYAESWEVHESVFAQPSKWVVRAGWGKVARELLEKYPPRTPYKLYVGGRLQSGGRLDSRGANQPDGGAATVEWSGRDYLAPLHDSYVKHAVKVGVRTYAELVRFAMKECGLEHNRLIISDKDSNLANREMKAGVPITTLGGHRTIEEILRGFDPKARAANIGNRSYKPPQAKIGETWLRFIRRHLDRAGLMLWATADGHYVLSIPNTQQVPTYTLYRPAPGDPPKDAVSANVVSARFRDDRTSRHSEAIIYGRGGGKAIGRVKEKGGFVDAEMTADGYNQAFVIRDANVHSRLEASYLANRKLADERRNGWTLEYVVSGHTLPWFQDKAKRAVLTVDTVVQIEDREFGIYGPHYIESITRSRRPQTQTTIKVMRPDDVVLGSDEDG